MYGWSNSFAIGLPMIDAQHKQLFELIDGLHQAMRGGKSKEVLAAVLGKLVDYTVKHFGAEEGIMRSRNYSSLSEHMLIHEQFTARIREFEKQHKAGRVLMTIELMDFLQNWLVSHIRTIDPKVAAELRAA